MICLIEITYSQKTVQKPLIWEMSKKYDICFNIYRASVDDALYGHLVLEIEGDSRSVHAAVEFLEKEGVKVDYIQSDILLDSSKCNHCGLCTEVCYTKALKKDDWQQVSLDMSRCIRCLKCIDVCPQKAIERNRT